MIENLKKIITSSGTINRGDVIGVAVSGGSDSMSLLHCLLSLKKELNIKVVAININHNIRGDSSNLDSEFVKKFCLDNNVELCFKSYDVLEIANHDKSNIENIARRCRYEFFSSLIKSGKVDKIATAHNLCDNAESVLLHLTRGCGLNGVCGMEKITHDNIIRPLLDASKKTILEYLSEISVNYVDDESNLDRKYSRNLIRHNVIPELEKINLQAVQSIVNFSQIAKKDNEILNKLSREFYLDNMVYKSVIGSGFEHRAILKSIESITKINVFTVHLDLIVDLLANGKVGSTLDLPCGICAIKLVDSVRFDRRSDLNACDYSFKFKFGKTITPHGEIFIEEVDKVDFKNKEKNQLYIGDIDKYNLDELVIRNMQSGDVFKAFNGFTKKLNKYFTDKKIDKHTRRSQPLICKGETVLAIANIEVSEDLKVTDNSRKYILEFKEKTT